MDILNELDMIHKYIKYHTKDTEDIITSKSNKSISDYSINVFKAQNDFYYNSKKKKIPKVLKEIVMIDNLEEFLNSI